MKTSSIGPRRAGAILVWFATLLPALLIFVGFAVDLGLVFVVKAQMQAAADSAALAAALDLPGYHPERVRDFEESTAVNSASRFASLNLPSDGHGQTMNEQDVVFGQWDLNKKEFVAGETPYTAVRVTLSRTEAKGNPVPLFFLPLLLPDSMDVSVQATAMAAAKVGGSQSGGLIGLEEATVMGTGKLDGYDPTLGDYGGDNILDSGVTSNGEVSVGGTADVTGSAKSGVGMGDANVFGSANVSGDVTERFAPLELEPVVVPSVPNSGMNDNSSMTGSFSMRGRTLSLNSSDTATLPPGDYYFHDLDLQGSAELTIHGPQPNGDPTVVRVSGDMKITAQSQVNIEGTVVFYVEGETRIVGQGLVNTGRNPQDLKIFATGGDIHWAGGSDFHGWIYAPESALTIAGNADFYGGGAGKTVAIKGTADVHADQTLGLWDFNTPATRLVW
jgi:hypothetical protein